MKLSIVIPVYNVEDYVGQTLESVFATDATDFEVIVVNDGTKDGSMDVVRRYADRPNLTIIEQENQGLSAARNRGLDAARGDYVWFVDSDDFLVENGVGKVLGLLEERPGGDVLMFPLLRRSSDDCSLDRLDYHIPSALFNSGKEAFRQSIVSYFGWAQRYVIRRSLLLTDYWLRFPVGLLHEDTYFGAALIYSARTVYVMSEPVYIYRSNRQESIMAEPSVERSWSRVEVYRRLMVFATKKVAPEDQFAFRSFCFNNLVYSYDERLFWEKSFDFFVQSNGEYLYHQWCLIHPEASAITRMGRRLFFSSPRIYRMLKH